MSESEYDTYFLRFHKDRMDYLSAKEKYSKCPPCESTKQFIESENQLIYSCGEEKGKCSEQFTIQLPEYIHSMNRKKILQEEIHGSMDDYNPDIHDLSYINQTIVDPYILDKPGMKVRDNSKEEYSKKVDDINEKYKQTNKLKEIYKDGIKYHKQKIKRIVEQKKIIAQLHDESLSTNERKELLTNYIALGKDILVDYVEIQESLQQPLQMFLVEEKPDVIKKNTTYTEQKKPVPKKPVPKKSKQSVEKTKTIQKLAKPEDDFVIKYYSGSKEWKWLSTFNVANPFEYKGYTYPTVEHAFQSQKIDESHPQSDKYHTMCTDKDITPGKIKKSGGRENFEKEGYTVRKDWNETRVKIMKDINKAYYEANPEMVQQLLDTEDKSLQHSGFRIDTFWGMKKTGGNNHHGKILMDIRKSYQN